MQVRSEIRNGAAQFEGAAGMGTSPPPTPISTPLSFYGDITATNGVITNPFDTIQMARMNRPLCKQTSYIVRAAAPPGVNGDPAAAVLRPHYANAIVGDGKSLSANCPLIQAGLA